MQELKLLQKEIQNAFALFKEKNDEALGEIRRYGQASQGLTDTVDTLNKRLSELETRQRDIVTRANRPTMGLIPHQGDDRDSYELRKGFDRYLRTGDKSQYLQAAATIPEVRGLAEMVDTEGGVFVAPQLADKILLKAHNLGAIRSVANVVTISSDTLAQPIMGTATVSWTTENASVADQNLTNEMMNINVYEMKALVKLSNRLLEDAAYDVQGSLTEEFSRAFAEEEDNQFANGAHPLKPGGLFSNLSVQANVVKSGVAAALYDSTHNGVDALIDLQFTPKAVYRKNGVWAMNSQTEAMVRKLKDSIGTYLWQPSTSSGAPATLLGNPIIIVQSAPSIGANTFPVVFGDFSVGYQIVDRIGLTVKFLDQLYAINSQTGFLARKRVGGEVVLPEAFAALKIST